MTQDTYDVAIVGGGIIGASIAYNLMRAESNLRLVVIEKDPTYMFASTPLSLGNIRVQFELKENVQISLYAIDCFKRFEDEMAVNEQRPQIGYRREGNLYMVDLKGRNQAEKNLFLQKSLGALVEWWPAQKVKELYPLYEVTNFVGGTFGPDDGYLDPYSVLMGYKAKARSLGTVFMQNEAERILIQDGRAAGIVLKKGGDLRAAVVVNAAGAWAAQLAQTTGIELPILPIKRQVFALETAVKPEKPLPLTFLPSGLFFRSEANGQIFIGKSFETDPVEFNFSWDRERFMTILWPELADFVPAFDRAKLVRGWAGLYEVNTFDHNAILGEWPGLKGFYLANGFSGHGIQQAPAVGRYMSELILGQKPVMNLSAFSPERILEKRQLEEKVIL